MDNHFVTILLPNFLKASGNFKSSVMGSKEYNKIVFVTLNYCSLKKHRIKNHKENVFLNLLKQHMSI